MRKIEIEVENLDMVKEAVEAGADIIMLDNMSPEMMKEAISLIDGRAETECSGNVTREMWNVFWNWALIISPAAHLPIRHRFWISLSKISMPSEKGASMIMKGQERRQEILHLLSSSQSPLSGTALAEHFSVSRQVIVQDMALIRAKGHEIIPTNRGYLLRAPSGSAEP